MSENIGILILSIAIIMASIIVAILAIRIVIKSESLGLRIKSYYKTDRRLQRKDSKSKDNKHFNPFESLEGKKPIVRQLYSLIESTGKTVDANTFLFAWIGGTLFATLIGILIGGIFIGIATLLIVGIAPLMVLFALRDKREKLFTEQLADSFPRIVSSLQSGRTLPSSIVSIAETSADPIASEFRRVKHATDVSVPIEDAIYEMSERMRSKDLILLAQAIDIQRESGGSLADIVENISKTIRYRIEMRQKIKSMTAEARFGGVIAAVAPILLLLLMVSQNEMYRTYFFDTETGHLCLIAMVVLDILSVIVIRKIYNIKID